MQQFRRLTAMIAVGMVLGSCTVTESSRSGGLIPPTGPAPTAVTTADTVVTVTAADGLTSVVAGLSSLSTDGLPPVTHGTLPHEPAQADPPGGGLVEARAVLAAAAPLEGFREGVLGVTGPAGTQLWPVIVADTPRARQRGLMGVEDFSALGGYAAMVFIFDGDTSGAFWMRDTPVPLRITFVTASGSVVSAADMVPCLPPMPSDECERYHPDGPYRIAIEHPIDSAYDIGLVAAQFIEVTVE